MIYSEDNIYNINQIDYKDDTFEPYPATIKMFEQDLYDKYIKDNNIYFEAIRYGFYGDNFGPKIDDTLKNKIIVTLKKYLTYTNEFEIMFLFSFAFSNYTQFKTLNQKELFYLLKNEGKIYLLFEKKYFYIDDNKNLIQCEPPKFEMDCLATKTKFHYEEFEFSLIDDIYENSIIYLFKIYYLGKELLEKKIINIK